jgi:hypothetical protein
MHCLSSYLLHDKSYNQIKVLFKRLCIFEYSTKKFCIWVDVFVLLQTSASYLGCLILFYDNMFFSGLNKITVSNIYLCLLYYWWMKHCLVKFKFSAFWFNRGRDVFCLNSWHKTCCNNNQYLTRQVLLQNTDLLYRSGGNYILACSSLRLWITNLALSVFCLVFKQALTAVILKSEHCLWSVCPTQSSRTLLSQQAHKRLATSQQTTVEPAANCVYIWVESRIMEVVEGLRPSRKFGIGHNVGRAAGRAQRGWCKSIMVCNRYVRYITQSLQDFY